MKKTLVIICLIGASIQAHTQPVPLYNKYWDGDTVGLATSMADEKMGTAFATGNFNGDSYLDLAIGEPGTLFGAGDVLILYGKPGGLTTEGSRYIYQTNQEAGDGFGSSLTVGDFDGDGYDDLVVGAPYDDVFDGSVTVADAGVISIFYGSPVGLPISAVEINGTFDIGANFGFSLAAGDFDGDGFDDVAIGAPGQDIAVGSVIHTDAGMVVIQKGSAIGLSVDAYIWEGHGAQGTPENDDNFGYSLAAGNFNLEGETFPNNYSDLAIGIPFKSFHATFDGLIEVLIGSPTGLGTFLAFTQDSLIGETSENLDLFGYTLAVGDITAGVSDDLIVGVPHEDIGTIDDAGVVNVIPGGSTGLTTSGSYTLSQNTLGIFGVPESGDRFGESVGSVWMPNQAHESILIGAPFESYQASDDGVAYVLYESNASSATSLFISGPNPNNNAHFGLAVGSIAYEFFSDANVSVLVGIPGQISGDNDLNAGAFLEVVYSVKQFIFGNSFE